ncbi:hypothetical protein Slin15195_G025710 [Septoria linicola]|uniref:Uncharacterized protein n=1 Tax=Septoria linicola TaxID=215465 RepID=A0A9Q9AHF1_9PEZI|nr:hypothetical protein Slin15195_G025710 [Septoria linicola]
MKPALTPLEKAYVSDPEGHDWSAWKARDEKIRAGVPSIMHSHHIHRCGRFGLYICGTPEEVVCQSDADGVPSAPPRDRMMVFVIELEPAERTKWVDIHAELSMLMYDVGVEENHGVCIRYYLNEDSTHPVGLPRLRMQPIPDTHTGPRGYAATFAEMTAAASWLVGHQARHPQQQNMSAEREAEMIRAIIDANRDSARRRLERENQDIPESSRVEFNTR